MKRNSGQYQYEPLMIPAGWQGEERRFAVRLTQLLDALHEKTGRLERNVKKLESLREGDDSDE